MEQLKNRSRFKHKVLGKKKNHQQFEDFDVL